MLNKIKLGISACLLGQKVRYDGGHKQDRFITDTLGKFVEFVPVCPEVECGLGVPREAMRLLGTPDSPRLVTIHTGQDNTERMVRWAGEKIVHLKKEGLCGFIFKSNSPTSGMERIKVYNKDGIPVKKGVGVFSRIFIDHFPLLPVEDEGRLHDPSLRENFLESLFTMKHWRECILQEPGLRHLVDFHTRHKLLILSHSPKDYRLLGKLVAQAGEIPRQELYARYQTLLMTALNLKTTVKKNVNVLFHIMGFFKKIFSTSEKEELLEVIDNYRMGYIPLIVPITLLNHYIRKYDQGYLMNQYYLNPHPVELKLRNHV